MIQADIEAQAADKPRSGQVTVYTCPDCGGVLWESRGSGLVQFQCHTGHRYGPGSLLMQKSSELEDTLYAAMRCLTEKQTITRQLGNTITQTGTEKEKSAMEAMAAIDTDNLRQIRAMLEATPNPSGQAHVVENALHHVTARDQV